MARRRNFAIISHPDAGKTTMVSLWEGAGREGRERQGREREGRERQGRGAEKLGEELARVGNLLACMQVQEEGQGDSVDGTWDVGLQGPAGCRHQCCPQAASVYWRRRLLRPAQPSVALLRCAVQTEKLLLYGGAIHEAGEVKARRWVVEGGDGGTPTGGSLLAEGAA